MIPGAERAGVVSRPADTVLSTRARALLDRGPVDPATLIGTICGLSNTPARLAEEMALALFAGRSEFRRDAEGRWLVVTPDEATAIPTVPAAPCGTLEGLTFAVVDVETTGGQPSAGDRITEVAVVIVRGGTVREVFETLVNPERPIPPAVTRLTNITWSMVCQQPTFADICDQLLGVLEGRVFVAHNAGFDWRFLTAEVVRVSGRRLAGPRLCTVRLARQLLPEIRRRSLDWVARHYGVEIIGRHRAGGDARATAAILLRLLDEAAGGGVRHWNELETLLSRRTGKRRRRRPPAMPQPVDLDTTA